MIRKLLSGLTLLLLSFSAFAADELQQLDAILKLPEAPAGVVFEMVGGDAKSLELGIDRARLYRNKIQSRFKNAQFVLLTHGLEQFSLLSDKQSKHPELHKKVKQIVESGEIKVEVCGNFAGNMGYAAEDFQKFVNVVDAAPAEIEEYRLKGYFIFEMEVQ